jgi:hypothetical protein
MVLRMYNVPQAAIRNFKGAKSTVKMEDQVMYMVLCCGIIYVILGRSHNHPYTTMWHSSNWNIDLDHTALSLASMCATGRHCRLQFLEGDTQIPRHQEISMSKDPCQTEALEVCTSS